MTDFGPCTCHQTQFAEECASCNAWKSAQIAAGGRPRYVIHPGDVHSIHDDQRHFIGYVQLMRLYGLRPEECVRFDSRISYESTAVHLYPRRDGDYSRGVR